jgi:hypothetical protein
MTVKRFEEIDRLIVAGKSDRFIARALGCRRSKVSRIRKGIDQRQDVGQGAPTTPPLWVEQVDWETVLFEIGQGYEIKKIWEEKSQSLTTYPNFCKQLHKRYPQLMKASVTLREFSPGDSCEVDYAGDRVEWMDPRSGEVFEAHIFVGILAFSQLIFAWASADEKSANWLGAHRRMYEAFGGVPHVTVCDCLKTGVSKTHRYDPDLNPGYSEIAAHYSTAIVPARPSRPKDKSLVEGAVGIVMRAFFFMYRKHTFTSIAEINYALAHVVDRINRKPHSRFKISRLERWATQEKHALKPLPNVAFEAVEWKLARVHPDCTISLESAYYSVPHLHRGKQVRIKLTSTHVEIFVHLERVALHSRDFTRKGNRHIINDHLPENAKAYREMTPQNLLSQARFITESLRSVIEELFSKDTLGNLRRAQGLIRRAHVEVRDSGREAAEPRIIEAIDQMRRFQNFRVRYFEATLTQLKQKSKISEKSKADREIQRLPGNPMLRYTQLQVAEEAEQRDLQELLPLEKKE